MDVKSIIAGAVKIDGASPEEIYSALSPTPDIKKGDLCLPCFKFAKAARKSPQLIAEELKTSVDSGGCALIERTAVEGGYLNFYFDRRVFARDVLLELEKNGGAVSPKPANGKTVCIDYSSVNIAKPFHIGHLLTTVIGGSLYRIYKYLGYNAVGINHLGDWGTQFGKMIAAYLRWGDDADIENRGVRALLDLYVRFHAEAETDKALEAEGRAWFKKIEDGDGQALEIFGKFKDITLREVKRVYEKLGVEFDSYAGESFYNDKMQPVIDELNEKGLLKASDGAMVVNLDEYGMPPCLILKSDGATLYATRDLAAAIYRKRRYDFYKNLYVVAYQQNLHFKQVFKVLELMGRDWAKDCVHVPFGMVSLEGQGALSTRKGNVVFLDDVLSAAVSKAEGVINSKNPDLEDKKRIASDVGIGAVIFSALSSGRIKDLAFSLDKALSFEGETAPYLQYTHARCRSVINRAGRVDGAVDYSALSDDDSFTLLRLLSGFDAAVSDAAEKYEPSILSRYLLDLASAFNQFYLNCRILGEKRDVMFTRLLLTGYVADVIKAGLKLLLINAPEKM
jgi:arginine--tRNA ligase